MSADLIAGLWWYHLTHQQTRSIVILIAAHLVVISYSCWKSPPLPLWFDTCSSWLVNDIKRCCPLRGEIILWMKDQSISKLGHLNIGANIFFLIRPFSGYQISDKLGLIKRHLKFRNLRKVLVCKSNSKLYLYMKQLRV